MGKVKQGQNMISQTAWDMLYLIYCTIVGTRPDPGRVAQMNQNALYRLASFHSLTALVGTGLQGMDTGDMKEHWQTAIDKAIRKTVLFDTERSALLSWMDEKQIWYMPLKGVILKDFYTMYGTRQMADNDILFDANYAEEVRDWFLHRGYTVKTFAAGVNDSYLKAPIYNFEMHRKLFSPSREAWCAYYENVKDRLVKDKGNGYGYHFTDEDFYIYFFTHAAKHFTGGGTGLRSLVDLYLFTSKKTTLNWKYIKGELEKLGLYEDEQDVRKLANVLFAGSALPSLQALSADQRALLSALVSAGTYGTIGQRVQNTMRINGWGKLQYMLNRFAVPINKKNPDYDAYAGAYPLFYQYKILLPLLPFYRIFRSMKQGRFKAEAKALKRAK